MRILIISRYPPFPGGRENFVLEFSNQISKENEVCVLTPDVETNRSSNPSIIKYPDTIQDLSDVIKNFKPDIINSHTFYLSDNALSIAKKKNIPFGITLHGDQFAIGNEQRQSIVSKISKESDFVINVSTNGKESLIKNVSGIDIEKIFVVNNGVNLEKFKDLSINKRSFRDEFNIGSDNFVVLTPTRMAPYKGIEFLLDTINFGKDFFTRNNFLFLISIPDYEFSEEENEHFDAINEKIRSLGLGKLIKITFSKYGDMHRLYNAADAFVLPSEKEQFPMSILEAMASGVPVIATNVGGIPELLASGSDSLLVDFGNLESLYDAIRFLYKKGGMKIQKVALQKVESMYSIVGVTSKYLEIYKKYLR